MSDVPDTIETQDSTLRETPSFEHLECLSEPVLFAAAGDPEGQDWIAGLPALLASMCREWALELDDGATRHGYHGVVVPVRRGSDRFVLKLTWPTSRIADEARALKVWNGNGAVRLIDADLDRGALLLERLDADQMLSAIPVMEALAVAGHLMRRLAIAAPAGFLDVRALTHSTQFALEDRQHRLGCPVPGEWLDIGLHLAERLATEAGNDLLVHADLHYENILAGEREPWLAVDPRPIAGEPEHAVPELLWTRVDEVDGDRGIRRMLAILVESGSLDAQRARHWAVVRCMDYWLWGIEHGLTEDPVRCRRIIQALL